LLSSARRAADFDGGFGIFNDGRWNTRGRPVTYCATVPSLAALEKRVHVTDPALLPPQFMITYHVPDGISVRRLEIDELPADWATQQTRTQRTGDNWLDAANELLLSVPSVIVPIATF
jgi:RES domain-containing protein